MMQSYVGDAPPTMHMHFSKQADKSLTWAVSPIVMGQFNTALLLDMLLTIAQIVCSARWHSPLCQASSQTRDSHALSMQ
jgi:hypothetical protein